MYPKYLGLEGNGNGSSPSFFIIIGINMDEEKKLEGGERGVRDGKVKLKLFLHAPRSTYNSCKSGITVSR